MIAKFCLFVVSVFFSFCFSIDCLGMLTRGAFPCCSSGWLSLGCRYLATPISDKNDILKNIKEDLGEIEQTIKKEKSIRKTAKQYGSFGGRSFISSSDTRLPVSSMLAARRALLLQDIKKTVSTAPAAIQIRTQCFLRRYSPEYSKTFNREAFPLSASELISDLNALLEER